MRVTANVTGLLLLMVLGACGAATPETASVDAAQDVHAWPMTTASAIARKEVADGLREWDMGRDVEAHAHFIRAVAADSTSPTAYAMVATAGLDFQEMQTRITKAMQLLPAAGDIERIAITIRNDLVNGNEQDAKVNAARLVAADSNNPRSWLLLAEVDSLLQQTAESRAALEKAIAVAPTFAAPYMRLSASYAASDPRDFARAEELARKAIELAPDEALGYDMLGDALRMQDKLEEAGQNYTKEAELDPTKGDGVQQRGHVNLLLGRGSEARADYKAAAARTSGNGKVTFAWYPALATLYEGRRRESFKEFNEVFNAVDAMNVPDPGGSKFAILQNQFQLALYDRVLPELESVVAMRNRVGRELEAQVNIPAFTHYTRARETLDQGAIAFVKGDYAAAKRAAAEAMRIRQADQSTDKDEEAHSLLGRVALDEKRYADALREFNLAGPSIEVDYFRALSLEGLGRDADAQQLFSKIAAYRFVPIDLAIVKADALKHLKKPA